MDTKQAGDPKTWKDLSNNEKATGVIFFIVVIILGIWGVMAITTAIIGGGNTSPQPQAEVPTEHTDIDVYIDAQAIIKETLKSPSTAKFPSSAEAKITRGQDNVFNVKSYVDSQNSFGATIRSDWSVMFQYVGDKLDTYAISIDGETVYRKPGI
ncbi:MAG: hypothetical protein WBK28_00270 [Minisyncoccia bacterium]